MDAIHEELNRHFASAAQWSFTPGWTTRGKDGWNAEDLSIVAPGGDERAGIPAAIVSPAALSATHRRQTERPARGLDRRTLYADVIVGEPGGRRQRNEHIRPPGAGTAVICDCGRVPGVSPGIESRAPVQRSELPFVDPPLRRARGRGSERRQRAYRYAGHAAGRGELRPRTSTWSRNKGRVQGAELQRHRDGRGQRPRLKLSVSQARQPPFRALSSSARARAGAPLWRRRHSCRRWRTVGRNHSAARVPPFPCGSPPGRA